MDQKAGKKDKKMFRALTLWIGSVCSIAILVMAIYVVLHLEPMYLRTLSREMEAFTKSTSDVMNAFTDECMGVVADLANDRHFKEMLGAQGVAAIPDIYNIMYTYRTRLNRNTTLHLLPPDRSYAVSLGYNTQEYVVGNYAGIDQLLLRNGGPILVPKHFVNTNGDAVALVIADQIVEDGRLLGYIVLDIPDLCIRQELQANALLIKNSLSPYVGRFIATWYDYLVYQDSPLQSVYSGNYLLDSRFTESFQQSDPSSRRYTENDISYLVTGYRPQGSDYVVICSVRLDYLLRENRRSIAPAVALGLSIALIGLLIVRRIRKEILVPIGNILVTLRAFDEGDMTARCNFETNNEVTQIGDQLNQIIMDVDRAMKNDREKQQLLRLAENNMLKAQIKPHFLNNVLESIYWMVRMGKYDSACTALTSLGRITSARMKPNTDFFETVSDSIALTRYYITLQQLCYPDKFDVAIDITSEDADERIPVFILQPLVENAMVHGIQPMRGRGTVRIATSRDERYFYIQVEDDGVGMKPEEIQRIFASDQDGGGIALYNIRRRIQLHYGSEGRMEIASEPGRGTVVRISIPLKGEQKGLCSH